MGTEATPPERPGAESAGGPPGEVEDEGGPAVLTPPSALARMAEIARRLEGRRPAVFLDYDGTLTPIVERPELAVLSEPMRATIAALSRRCPVAIVSGRDRSDVERLVGLDSVFYAGSHGFDILGPGGRRFAHEAAARCVPPLRQAEAELRRQLGALEGLIVEGKAYAVAVHHRLVREDAVPRVEAAVDAAGARYPELRKTGGKKVFELRPRLDWDKGRAILWLLEALGLDAPDAVGLYLGDDLTDEDAFRVLDERGVGILVSAAPEATQARYVLRDPGEVRLFLERLLEAVKASGR